MNHFGPFPTTFDAQIKCHASELHEAGMGTVQNYPEARRLYSILAAQGDEQAIEALERVNEIIRTNTPCRYETPHTGVRTGAGIGPAVTRTRKPKPNGPCLCGSGKKYKKCCRLRRQGT